MRRRLERLWQPGGDHRHGYRRLQAPHQGAHRERQERLEIARRRKRGRCCPSGWSGMGDDVKTITTYAEGHERVPERERAYRDGGPSSETFVKEIGVVRPGNAGGALLNPHARRTAGYLEGSLEEVALHGPVLSTVNVMVGLDGLEPTTSVLRGPCPVKQHPPTNLVTYVSVHCRQAPV